MVGERLKQIRKEKGYTQVTLAKALGVSKGTVALWETRNTNPETETLDALLDLLDVNYDYLQGRTNVRTTSKPSEDDLKQMAAWTLADTFYDTVKMYLSLDSYGQSAVENLIKSEMIRCREQKTSIDTSAIKVSITVDKNSVEV